MNENIKKLFLSDIPQENLLELSKSFHLNTIYKFAIQNSKYELLKSKSSGKRCVLVNPFLFAIDDFSGNDVLEFLSFNSGYYLILKKDNPELKVLEERVKVQTRKHFTSFNLNRDKLERNVSHLNQEFNLVKIDQSLFVKIKEDQKFKNHLSLFDSYGKFKDLGIGYCLLENSQIVSIASSFSATKDSIEIQVDTISEKRSRGYARIVCSQLILSCFDQNITPLWDAATTASKNLAIDLGFSFPVEYQIYY